MLSLCALVATAGLAYMGAVLGAYRAALALVALIIAGVVGFGLMGPLAGMCGADNHDSIWYFIGDAFWLWAVTAAVFLALRTAGERFLQNQSQLPLYIERPAGAVLGLAMGYLTVGLCTVLLQMLPTSPDLLGYEAFKYTAAKRAGEADRVEPTDSPLWLRWDRGTLAFFGYLSWWPLGPIASDHGSLFDRYGDLCPPNRPDHRGPDYTGKLNTDDILYYYWYRRYEYILWQVGRATGPVPEPIRLVRAERASHWGPTSRIAMQGLAVNILSVERAETVEGFPQLRASSDEDFVRVRLRLAPIGDLPRVVDTDQFVLLESNGNRIVRPHVLARARTVGTQHEIVPELSFHATVFQARAPVRHRRRPELGLLPGGSAPDEVHRAVAG